MATGGADEDGGISRMSEETMASNAPDSGFRRGPVSQAKREELLQRSRILSYQNRVITANSIKKDELIHQLTLEIKSLKDENEQLKRCMRVHEAREHRENDLEQALGTEREISRRTREKNRELQMEMEAQVRDYNLDTRVHSDYRLLREENQRLQGQVFAISSQLAETNKEINQMRDEIQLLNTERNGAYKRFENKSKELESARHELFELFRKTSMAATENSFLQKTITQLTDDNCKLQSEIQMLKHDKEQLREKEREYRRMISKLSEQILKLKHTSKARNREEDGSRSASAHTSGSDECTGFQSASRRRHRPIRFEPYQ
ncbi:protein scabrous [Lingula anatina]|uniref:Protein scabrous n=1 Tax=Lingula anatina TaxID=7574 RepID=A0A1S3H2K0_LINAN|nr:protein scabrous [Lingula anatina]XP_013379705.1 protein scabrous [Lingula anatina]XP_013379706.1 protein scabrous [Lingula anatina]XP_013379707.1 protein scabrous [Lingula anatina]|eukprot:XP_013379704.1 protein scabrous [Lingula anatina]